MSISMLVVGFSQTADAQGPQGHVAYIYPAGGQQGQTVEVIVGGADLDEAKEVRVSGEGVTGKVVKFEKGKTVTVSLSIAANAPSEVRDLRLVTPSGATNRARFVVGQIPEIQEKEPNSDRNSAQAIPSLPVVINGQIFEADRDLFRFSAKAGQTIVCDAKAERLLPFIADGVPGWFQAVLTLYDSNGKTIDRADHYQFHPDPVLIHKIEKDGDYVIEIKDSLFRGRNDFVYRLSVGELPFISYLTPLGAKRDGSAKISLFGSNLPTNTLTLPLKPDSPSVLSVDVKANEIISNALPFAVGTLPETREHEPNNTMDQAQAVDWPITINGRIQKPGDVDFYVFKPDPKQKLVMEVFARRLESPLDSTLTLYDTKRSQVQQNDDYEDENMPQMTHHADSRIVYTFKNEEKHYLRVADIQGHGGEDYAYRLTIAPMRPDFELRVTPDNPRVGQGATTVLSVKVLREDGFDGPIELSVENLPKGFAISGTTIPSGANEGMVTLTAPTDVALGIYSPSIVGKAEVEGKPVVRKALAVEDVMQAFYYHHLLPTQEMLLTLLEPPPFNLIPQMPPEGYFRFGDGRTAFVTIKAERKNGVKGPIRLTLSNPPKGVSMPAVTIPPDQDEAKLEIRMANQLPSSVRYNLIIAGTMNVDKKALHTISPAIIVLGSTAKAPSKP
jgi:hypothetical protein